MVRPRVRIIKVRRPVPLVARELVAVQVCRPSARPFVNRLPMRVEFASINNVAVDVRQLAPAPQVIRMRPVELRVITLQRQQVA